MITLHHLNNSRSQRILWLLEELNLPYEIKRYQRNKLTMLAPQELKQVHPLGKSPVITDGENTVAESGAIIEYLLDKYGSGKLRSNDKLKFTYCLHFAEGSVMPQLLLALIFTKMQKAVPVLGPLFTAPVKKLVIEPNLKSMFTFIEDHLTKNEWFAGAEFSAADIQMSFPLEAASTRAGVLGVKSQEWLKKIHSREAYQKALKKGGEFNLKM